MSYWDHQITYCLQNRLYSTLEQTQYSIYYYLSSSAIYATNVPTYLPIYAKIIWPLPLAISGLWPETVGLFLNVQGVITSEKHGVLASASQLGTNWPMKSCGCHMTFRWLASRDYVSCLCQHVSWKFLSWDLLNPSYRPVSCARAVFQGWMHVQYFFSA